MNKNKKTKAIKKFKDSKAEENNVYIYYTSSFFNVTPYMRAIFYS